MPQGRLLKAITVFTLMCHGAAAFASGIVAAPNAAAGTQPTVITAPNGLPVVNIAAPGSGGVSHNQYTQFNVGSGGAILNNAPQLTTTQLAGYINGNPNLSTGNAAALILNEVIAPNPSLLQGMLEVAGQKAEVVLANPWGISVQGGAGFINTSRATLTTGVPQLSNGNLTGYRVTGGTVSIDGQADVSNLDSFNIISRALQVNAGLYAKQLNVVLGANQVDKTTLNATPIQGSAPAPSYALDVAQLGGMYAGAIKLIGTEAGVGVNSQGYIEASSGALQLTSAGDLTLAGSVSAQGDMSLQATGNLNNTGTTSTAGNLNASAAQAQLNGTMTAANNLSVSASTIGGSGTIAAGVQPNGTLTGTGALAMTASQSISQAGQLLAAGNLSLQSNGLTLDNATVSSLNGDITLSSQGNLSTQSASVTAGNALNVMAAAALNNQQGMLNGQSFTLSANSLNNQGGKLLGLGTGASQLTISQTADNSQHGQIGSNGDLAATIGNLNNAAGTLTSAGQLSLSSQGQISNQQGTIAANGLGLTASALNNAGGKLEQVGTGTASVNVGSGTLDNSQGGTLLSNGQLTVTTGTLNNNAGTLGAQGDVSLTASQSLTNLQGTLASQGMLTATAGSISNDQGLMQGSSVNISTQNLSNTAGTINAAGSGSSTLTASQLLSNAGTIASNGNLNFIAATLNNQGGTVTAQGNLSLTASQLPTVGTLQSGNDLTLNLQSDLNNGSGSTIQANHDLTVNTTGDINNAGTLQAVHDLSLTSQSLNNSGQIVANGTLTANAANSLTNTATGTLAGQTVNLTAPTQNNQGLITGQTLTLTGTDLGNDSSTAAIAATGNLSLQFGNSINNTNGALINADGDLAIGSTAQPVTTLNNNQSTIQAGGNATVNASTFTNQSNPVTVTQSSTSSSKTQTTTGLGTTCNGGGNMGGGGNHGDGNYRCTASITYVLGYTFSNGVMSDLTTTYSNTNGRYGSGVDSSSSLTVYSILSNNPATNTLVLKAQTVTPTNNSQINLSDSAWSDPNNPIWSQNSSNVTTSTVTVSYFAQQGNTYLALPNYNPNTNLIDPSLQGSANTVTVLSPGQVATTASAFAVEGADGYPTLPSNVVTLAAGQAILSGRDTVAQVNETTRTTNTTVTTDAASNSVTPANLLVGSNLVLNGQTINNLHSNIEAGGNLTVQAGTQVNNVGQSLNQVTTTQTTSQFQGTGSGPYTSQNTSTSTVQVGSVDAILSANQALAITAPSINNNTVNAANLPAASSQTPSASANSPALVGNPVSSHFTLPAGGLFNTVSGPGQHYLIETNPQFTQYANFVSSNYMLQQLGYNPNTIAKRLGDGYYEQQLVAQTVTNLTGQRFLSGDTSAEQEYQNLMNNGVQYAQQFGLTLGVSLSAAQMAQLTSPMVWLVSQTVDGQQVLVPEVYLPGSTASSTGQGAVMAGKSMALVASGDLTNSGTLSTQGGTLSASAQNINLNGGVVQSDQLVTLQASQNLNLNTDPGQQGRTATVSAGSALLQAGNNIQLNAAHIATTGDATLSAGNNLAISNTQQTLTAQTSNWTNEGKVSQWNESRTSSAASTINTGGNLALNANNNLDVSGSSASANGNLTASAGNTLNVQSTIDTTSQQQVGRYSGFTQQTQTINTAGLSAQGNLALAAGQDVNLTGAQLQAGSTATIQSGQDVNINALASTNSASRYQSYSGSAQSSQTDVSQTGSIIGAGSNLTIAAGQNLNAQGATLAATQTASLTAGQDIQLGTSQSAHTDYTKTVSNSSGLLRSSSATTITTHDSTTLNGTQVSGGQIAIEAGRDVGVTASTLNAQQELDITAGRDISLNAQTRKDNSTYFHQEQTSGFSTSILNGLQYGSSKSQENDAGTASLQTGSTLSGQNVQLSAGRDANATAASVLADQSIQLEAGRNINILAASNTQQVTQQSSSSGWSLGLIAGLAPKQTLFGTTFSSNNGTQTAISQSTSLLSANAGNLTIIAGGNNQYTGSGQGNLLTQGANLQAAQTETLQGNNVTLDAVANQASDQYHQETQNFTIGSQLAGTVGGAITAIYSTLQAAQQTNNNRLQGALDLKAGYDAYKLLNGGITSSLQNQAQSNLLNQNSITAGNGPTVTSNSAFGVSATVGSSSSAQDSLSSSSTQQGTTAQAQTLNITATDGNLSATAAKLQATDISLSASKDIDLQAAANTSQIQSDFKANSTGVGVTAGFGQQNGISFQLSASRSNGSSNGSETIYDNSLVTATDHLNLTSGNDTNLIGAQLAGNTVNMNVGGNLNLLTLQNTSNFTSQQSSSGFSLSICVPPICYGQVAGGTLTLSSQDINHDYLSAVGQTGIAAGTGGFNIAVSGNTGLTGAAITSQAAASQNTLQTTSLSYQDLANSQNTHVSSSSIGLAYGSSASMMSNLANTAVVNGLAALASDTGLPSSGSQSSQTLSVISPATISLTGSGATSQAAVATLTSRDASTANGALTNTLTLQQAQQITQNQATAQQNAQAAAAVGAVLTNAIGDIAQQQKWVEGSVQKTLLHGLAGVIEAKLAGGNAAAGFAAGAVNEQLTPLMDAYLTSHGIMPGSDDYASLMKAGSTLAGAATGALVGGTTQSASQGAVIANVATTNNILLHIAKKLPYLTDAENKLLANAVAGCNNGNDTYCSQEMALLQANDDRAAQNAKQNGLNPLAVSSTGSSDLQSMRDTTYGYNAKFSSSVYSIENTLSDIWDKSSQALPVSNELNAVFEIAGIAKGLQSAKAAYTDSEVLIAGADVPVSANSLASTANGGAVSSVQAARLNMQLSAEQAAGVSAPTQIVSYSDHAISQIASRDSGVGVNQAAVTDAFSNPVSIQYVPSKYGPAFKYVGQNATVVVNPQGNVVTAWGTSSAGVAK